MLRRTLLASSLAALALTASPPRAEACSPPLPGLYGSLPADGASYPANAALFFSGYDVTLDDTTVTVAGQPATLTTAGTPGGLGLSALIVPAPQAGDEVIIEGTFCPAGSGCPSKKITFTATAPDTTPPKGADAASFDVYDYADYHSSGGDCTSDSDLAEWVQLKGPTPDAGGSPVIFTLEAYRDAGLTDLVFTRSGFLPETGQAEVELRLFAADLGGKSAPEALCFHVSTKDAAGNPAPSLTESPVVVCKPCNYRVSDAPNTGFGPPPEPMWSGADAYPGGPCDPHASTGAGGNYPDAGLTTGSGGGSSGGNDEVIGGCSCQVGDEAGGAGASLGGIALVAAAMARAGRRRRGR